MICPSHGQDLQQNHHPRCDVIIGNIDASDYYSVIWRNRQLQILWHLLGKNSNHVTLRQIEMQATWSENQKRPWKICWTAQPYTKQHKLTSIDVSTTSVFSMPRCFRTTADAQLKLPFREFDCITNLGEGTERQQQQQKEKNSVRTYEATDSTTIQRALTSYFALPKKLALREEFRRMRLAD